MSLPPYTVPAYAIPAAVTTVALPRPRRCWTLAHDLGDDVWEVADFDVREALAVTLPSPRWDGHTWVEVSDAPALVFTWAPDAHGLGCWWIPEESLY